MKVDKFNTQKYLSAAKDKDLDGKSFVIDAVFPETINDVEKVCMRLRGVDKPLVLNQTNLHLMMSAFGDDTDRWVNNTVVLRIIDVMFNGQTTKGIQVKIR